jgi:CRP-like cAMP-binding protein
MASKNTFSKGNRLLNSLTPADLGLLAPSLEELSLPLRTNLESPNKPIEYVHFMETGFASVVGIANGTRSEVGIIGCEGMTGQAVLHGAGQSPYSTYIQLAGSSKRIAVAELKAALSASPSLHLSLLKSVHCFCIQTGHTAIANGRADIPQRLARWLLMAHDRTLGNDMALTHDFLALMLSVRRAGVTEAIGHLKADGLIDTFRGGVIMVDRKGVEKIAASFYGIPEKEHRRLVAVN